MRISDWSSDVCSSDLGQWIGAAFRARLFQIAPQAQDLLARRHKLIFKLRRLVDHRLCRGRHFRQQGAMRVGVQPVFQRPAAAVERLPEIGRAHVLTPVTNALPVCRLLLENKKLTTQIETANVCTSVSMSNQVSVRLLKTQN